MINYDKIHKLTLDNFEMLAINFFLAINFNKINRNDNDTQF